MRAAFNARIHAHTFPVRARSSAVGVPPKEVVEKFHAAKIPVANIIGHPKHVPNAIKAGCDVIIYQGGEGGGHTGDVPLSILGPRVVDLCRGHKSPLTGKPIITIAAGGIWNVSPQRELRL